MEKFIFLFRGGVPTDMSPEAMQANMQKWTNWMGELAKQGKLQGGDPLNSAGKRLVGKDKQVIDGPFTEAKEVVGGYLAVTAAHMDEAVELAKGCPIFEDGGQVEVRQVRPM